MNPPVSSSLAGTSVPKNQPDTVLDTVRDFSHAGAQIRLNWRGQPWQQLSVITPSDGPFWSSVEMTMGQARAVAAIMAEFDRVHALKETWNPSLEEPPFANGTTSQRPGAAGAQMQTCVRDVDIRQDLKSQAPVVKESLTTGLNPNKNPSGEAKVPLMDCLAALGELAPCVWIHKVAATTYINDLSPEARRARIDYGAMPWRCRIGQAPWSYAATLEDAIHKAKGFLDENW